MQPLGLEMVEQQLTSHKPSSSRKCREVTCQALKSYYYHVICGGVPIHVCTLHLHFYIVSHTRYVHCTYIFTKLESRSGSTQQLASKFLLEYAFNVHSPDGIVQNHYIFHTHRRTPWKCTVDGSVGYPRRGRNIVYPHHCRKITSTVK